MNNYYRNLRDKIFMVEQQGFNPYTESYETRIGQIEATQPTNPNEPIKPDESDESTKQAVESDKPAGESNKTFDDLVKLHNDYRQEQAKITQVIAEENPNIPVQDILQKYSDMAEQGNFSNYLLDKYTQELTKEYGELLVPANRVQEISPNFYQLQQQLREGDLEWAKNTINTRGDKEGKEPSYFGWRELLEQRPGTTRIKYDYLENIKTHKN